MQAGFASLSLVNRTCLSTIDRHGEPEAGYRSCIKESARAGEKPASGARRPELVPADASALQAKRHSYPVDCDT